MPTADRVVLALIRLEEMMFKWTGFGAGPILIWLVLVSLTGCSKPYNVPSFDAGGREISSMDVRVQFEGLASHIDQNRITRVLWMHGMCTHNAGWALNNVNALKAALDVVDGTSPDIPESTSASSIETFIITNRGNLQINFPLWSPITSPLKDRLRFDNTYKDGGEFGYERAGLNNGLKRILMNDCLTDAVVVAGPNREGVYEFARRSLCEFLSGTFVPPLSCKINDPQESSVARVVITESLGSKIVADAILELKPVSGQHQIFAERLSTIRQIFLVANQIPFLDLAGTHLDQSHDINQRDIGSFESSLNRFVERLRPNAGKDDARSRIQIVAFSDPNDLLGYRLSQEHVDTERMNLINVIVSNDYTLTPILRSWSLERPDTAHCGYLKNANVLAMIAAGNPGSSGITWRSAAENMDLDRDKRCGL